MGPNVGETLAISKLPPKPGPGKGKGLMKGHLREKLGAKETKVQELLAWKDVQIGKLDLTKQLLKDSEAQVEALKKILKDKEAEILEAKSQLYQAKEDAKREYHDSNDLLRELSSSFADGFNDFFCQVKASFPDLDLSHISIDAQPRTPAQPIYSKGTDELFASGPIADPQGDREIPPVDQAKLVGDEPHPLEEDQRAEGKDGENHVHQE